jgi:hypothetical protein
MAKFVRLAGLGFFAVFVTVAIAPKTPKSRHAAIPDGRKVASADVPDFTRPAPA